MSLQCGHNVRYVIFYSMRLLMTIWLRYELLSSRSGIAVRTTNISCSAINDLKSRICYETSPILAAPLLGGTHNQPETHIKHNLAVETCRDFSWLWRWRCDVGSQVRTFQRLPKLSPLLHFAFLPSQWDLELWAGKYSPEAEKPRSTPLVFFLEYRSSNLHARYSWFACTRS